jgi:hypothetical protein
MTKATRGRYTLEFKQEAARLVESGAVQEPSSAAASERRSSAGPHPGRLCGEPGSLRLAAHLAATAGPKAFAWANSVSSA